jgi:excisionase family DNA binding protein
MTEDKSNMKMNLEHERRIVELQERVTKLENLCYTTKEVLNLEEAAAFLGMAKSTLYKLTHQHKLPYYKPAGKLIFFEKKALLDWVYGAKALSEEEVRQEAAEKLKEMDNRP